MCHVSGVNLGDRASAMLTYIMNHQQAVSHAASNM